MVWLLQQRQTVPESTYVGTHLRRSLPPVRCSQPCMGATHVSQGSSLNHISRVRVSETCEGYQASKVGYSSA